MKTILLVFCILVGVVLTEDQCAPTNLEFYTHYSLARTPQLNKTFEKLQVRIPYLNNVTYVANETATFKVVNIKPIFYYYEAKQEVVVTEANTIIVHGGRVDVRMPFEWSKAGPFGAINGTGEAFVISDEILIEKNIIDVDGYVQYNLVSYDNVTYSQNKVLIARIDPANTTKEDIDTITKMFNDIINHTTVRHVLEDDILEYYGDYLN